MLKWINFINMFVLFSIFCFSQTCDAAKPGTWQYYKNTFISSDGRIIDYYKNRSSHSEGQGYGMLLAIYHNDKSTFNKILNWTRNNLKIRNDNLFAWHWGKRVTGDWGIIDYNNATDGDLLIAWALLKAYEKWKRPEFKKYGLEIAKSIKKKLIINRKGNLHLMPGYYGFHSEERVTLNPSYFIYPAFAHFSRYEDTLFWQKLSTHCLNITFYTLFTRLKLPANWIRIDKNGTISLDHERRKYFGYEAIRIPLYLSISKKKTHLRAFSKYLNFNEKLGYLPDVIDLEHEQVSINEAPAGFCAVVSACAKSLGRNNLSKKLMKRAVRKIKKEHRNYYSHSLYLIARKVISP